MNAGSFMLYLVMLYLVIKPRVSEPKLMYPPEILKSIYDEHDRSVPCMSETLLALDVPFDDVALLRCMPWRFPANRIAVERQRLGLPAVHVLLAWKLPPPPPAWLTPAVICKMFDLALRDLEQAPSEDGDDDNFCEEILI